MLWKLWISTQSNRLFHLFIFFLVFFSGIKEKFLKELQCNVGFCQLCVNFNHILLKMSRICHFRVSASVPNLRFNPFPTFSNSVFDSLFLELRLMCMNPAKKTMEKSIHPENFSQNWTKTSDWTKNWNTRINLKKTDPNESDEIWSSYWSSDTYSFK